ncbi:MAG: recombinase family protein, partial [Synergistaceae bacterium]|nr:recombinase family protein [Synergistaceae bacterium]
SLVYGYARVSTMGQARDGNSLEAQENALRQAGAERIFRDVYSGKPERRPQLDRLLKVIENGDKLIITRLDRIARSLIQGVQLLETLNKRGVIVEVLNMGVIDDTATGKLIRNIMLSFSEFEHDMIVQRTQEGKAIARQNADFKDGRPKKYSRVQLNHALELLETHSYKQVERLTGISVTTIYRAKLERAKTKHLRQRASSQ